MSRLFYRGLKIENDAFKEIINSFNILDEELKKYGFMSIDFYRPKLFNADYELLESFTVPTTIDFLNNIINNTFFK